MTITFTLHGETYSISREDVLRVARMEPDRISGYYVEILGRRFPPTQLVHLAARTRTRPHPRNSRSHLARLGFTTYPVGQSLPTSRQCRSTTGDVTADNLAKWRRTLLRILDHLDGRPTGAGPAGRISRLVGETRVPRTIAAHMRVVLEHRNAAEYENVRPTGTEGEAVRSSWSAILEWASSKGMHF